MATTKSPFIHQDGKTLYFSSDSLPDSADTIIYYSKKDDKGNWGQPVNLGYPINTEADEVGFFVSTNGKTGYFATNKIKGSADTIFILLSFTRQRDGER
jgi:YHS domain-containing protein